jgi:hypothetical protein
MSPPSGCGSTSELEQAAKTKRKKQNKKYFMKRTPRQIRDAR